MGLICAWVGVGPVGVGVSEWMQWETHSLCCVCVKASLYEICSTLCVDVVLEGLDEAGSI